MYANAKIAQLSGVHKDNCIVMENGGVVDMKAGIPRKVGEIPVGYVYVDGKTVGSVTEDDLADRRILAYEGVLCASMCIDLETSTVVAGPDLYSRAFAPGIAGSKVFRPVLAEVRKAVEDALDAGVQERQKIANIVKKHISRWVFAKFRTSPMVLCIISVSQLKGAGALPAADWVDE